MNPPALLLGLQGVPISSNADELHEQLLGKFEKMEFILLMIEWLMTTFDGGNGRRPMSSLLLGEQTSKALGFQSCSSCRDTWIDELAQIRRKKTFPLETTLKR